MQLSKPFSYDENSLFAQNFLHADLCLPQEMSSKPQESPQNFPTPHESQKDVSNLASRVRFYQQHKKIWIVAYHLFLQKRRQCDLADSLNQKIKLLQDRFRDSKFKDEKKSENSDQNKAKRSRRTAELIEKKHKCGAAYCSRSYGSEGSLQQHIKIKHPEIYQKNQYDLQDESQYDDGSL